MQQTSTLSLWEVFKLGFVVPSLIWTENLNLNPYLLKKWKICPCTVVLQLHTHMPTSVQVCVLTVPSKLHRAMSAYAERNAAGRREEIKAKYILHSHSLYFSPGCWCTHTGWLRLLCIVKAMKALIRTNLFNVSRLATWQSWSCNFVNLSEGRAEVKREGHEKLSAAIMIRFYKTTELLTSAL